jgi:predicted metal-dependent hydrolase
MNLADLSKTIAFEFAGVPCQVRVSARAKNLRLILSPRDGLTVVTPAQANPRQVQAFMESRRAWVQRHWQKFAHAMPLAKAALPETLELRAVGETWQVEYRAATLANGAAKLRQLEPGRLLWSGDSDNPQPALHALQCWLAGHARLRLLPWLDDLSAATGLSYHSATIRGQRSRWGSCSGRKTLNLNYKLLFLPEDWTRYVLLHELCHTRELNHSPRFWALLERHEPASRQLRLAMRDAWRLVPAWVGESGRVR